MREEAAGIILAGGRSSRMGRDKALLAIDGETLLARTLRTVSPLVTEVLIVGRTMLPPELAEYTAIDDAYPDAGPLGGIATGLAHIEAERALVVACDLPFLQRDLLELLLRSAGGFDAVVPRTRARGRGQAQRPDFTGGVGDIRRGGPQPTCAVYDRSCLPLMRDRLVKGQYRLRDVLGHLRVRWVEDEEISRVDPEYRSFLHANTLDEWDALSRADSTQRLDSE